MTRKPWGQAVGPMVQLAFWGDTMPTVPGRVSVIMPVYNSTKWLPESVGSVMTQDYPDVELIVADDGSTDGSPDMAEKLGAHRVLRLPHRGPTAARNDAIKVSTGEFLAFLDADDRYHSGRLRRGVECLRENPEAGMAVCSARIVDPTGKVLDIRTSPPEPRDDFVRLMFLREWISTPTATVRRSVANAVGHFNPRLAYYTEDYEWFLRVGSHSPVVWLPDVLSDIRRHSESLSAVGLASVAESTIRICRGILRDRPDLRLLAGSRFGQLHRAAALGLLRNRSYALALPHVISAFACDPAGTVRAIVRHAYN